MSTSRRDLLAAAGRFIILSVAAQEAMDSATGDLAPDSKYRMAEHYWAMTIDINKCIGCGNCVKACAQENGVPRASSEPGWNAIRRTATTWSIRVSTRPMAA